MTVTLKAITPPHIFVNGVEVSGDLVETNAHNYTNNRTFNRKTNTGYRVYTATKTTPVTITMTTDYPADHPNTKADDYLNNAKILFNFNAKTPPNLGSKMYGGTGSTANQKTITRGSGPIHLYSNATGSDVTVIRAITHYHGRYSAVKTVTIKIVNTATGENRF